MDGILEEIGDSAVATTEPAVATGATVINAVVTDGETTLI
jgi:hypothetical protein